MDLFWGRYRFGRHCCGRHGLAVIVLRVAVMDFFGAVIVCGRHGFGRHSLPCGRHGLWPSSSFPSCQLHELQRWPKGPRGIETGKKIERIRGRVREIWMRYFQVFFGNDKNTSI